MTSRPTGCDDQLVSGPRQRWRGALVALTACCACTDVDLRSTPKPDDRIALSGTFCTGEPYDTARNLRVLFLVDSSSSMRFNDPNDLLVDSLEHLTQRYAAQPNISFAVIRWGSSRVVKENVDYAPIGTDPLLFTNDQVELAAIYARMRQPSTLNPLKYLDGTNFLLALGAATDYLVADIAKNPNESLTSRYLIEFVTDGMPQSATDDPAITRRNILSAVDNLATRYAARVDVSSIAQDVIAPPEFLGLLPAMARAGTGTYTQLTSPAGLDAIFDTTINHGANLLEYQLGTAFAWNPHLRPTTYRGVTDVFVDSDGDGLIDAHEQDLGTDPAAVDTDGDGLTDLFEVRAHGGYDPLATNVYDLADGGTDDDGDELSTFEELQLGTDPASGDSDRDGVPDDIELVMGTDPLTADATADPDTDQVPSATEVFEHTDPFSVEGQALRELIAYRPVPETLTNSTSGTRCYGFGVGNIGLAQTKASRDGLGRSRPTGFNELQMVVLARAVLGTAAGAATEKSFPVRMFRAHRKVIAGRGGSIDPLTHSLELQAWEFDR